MRARARARARVCMCICVRVFIVEAAFGDISAFVFAHEKEPLYTPVEREERRHTLVELKEAVKAHWASVHLKCVSAHF